MFDADGGFTVLPLIPRKVLEPWFRAEVLALLRREGLVTESLARKMLTWRHTGFSEHNAVRVGSRDASGRRRLAQLCAHIPDRFEHLVRYAWARLIHKVYEVDPLECPRCTGPMRVISLIDDAAVIRKILRHLGLWAPQQAPRTQTGPPAHDPPGQFTPVLTYHLVPDIA